MTRTAQLLSAFSRSTAPTRKRRPLETYKPSGKVSWPIVLVEGGEGTGKSHLMAEFTTDERVGRAYWFELGETSAHEFGSVGDYEVVRIDGTWVDLIDQVYNVVEVAEKAVANGEPPVVVCVDSISAVWDMCAGWAYVRATREKKNAAALREDPDSDITVGPLVWAGAKDRWYEFFRPLQMAPLIAVLSAKAADTIAIENGRPVAGKSAYKIRAQKELPYDVNAIVRLSQDRPPTVTKCRSPKWGVRPGVDQPKPIRDLTLGRLIFDGMGFDPKMTQVPANAQLETSPIDSGSDMVDHAAPWDAAKTMAANNVMPLIHVLATSIGVAEQDLPAYLSEIVGRNVESPVDLTELEMSKVVGTMQRAATQSEPPVGAA